MRNCIITFYSTHHALKAERVLKDKGISIELIPVPREFSSNCGIAMSFPWQEKNRALDILKDKDVEIEKTHQWERK